MLASHRCIGEWFDVQPEIAVAALAGAAHKLNQPLLPVTADVAEQILKICHDGGTAAPPKPRLQDNPMFILICALIGGMLTAYYVWSSLNP